MILVRNREIRDEQDAMKGPNTRTYRFDETPYDRDFIDEV